MRTLSSVLLFVISTMTLQAQYRNVKISDLASPNETSIMLDPRHPENLVAAANIASYYVSSDSGKTWQAHTLNCPYGVWGDPVITVDAKSNFYFFHLSNPDGPAWVDRIICQRSTSKGLTWNSGSFTGLNGSKVQDKPWVAVNRKSNHMYVTWTQFDAYNSAAVSDSSHILFSKSLDDGTTWSEPKRIDKHGGDCLDDDNTVEGAVPAIGPDGEVYVAWSGPEGIVFDRSVDGGETWMENDLHVTDMPGGWAYNVPGIFRANGLPITVCDTSQTATRGNIYINWTDQRNGAEDTDVFLIRSTDGGNTWSNVKRVNNDAAGRQQFFSWMTVDQVTGYIYVVFYDRRNYPDTRTDVYLAVSTDGGETFSNQPISETPFIPNETIFFGDYTNIVAYSGMVRPIWTRLHNDLLSVWTIVKDYTTTATDPFVSSDIEMDVYPNPGVMDTYVSFKLRDPSIVTLSVKDELGREALRLIDGEMYPQGKHILKVSVNDTRLKNGVYYYVLEAGRVHKLKRMVILR